MMSREIEVWGDWIELGGPVRMGNLRAIETRGKEVFSFEYEKSWLDRGIATGLDPDLRLLDGPQYLDAGERPNFGIFFDSSPDRWGRVLMQRREAARAREESRPERRLRELDVLVGVHDEQRSGGLRFRDAASQGEWLNDDPSMATPPWTSLRELEHASWQLQRTDLRENAESLKWLRLIIAPGSSLGGARPKAGVSDESGQLWIAKFPGRNDSRDIGAWEMLAHRLAKESGVLVSNARLEQFGGEHRTFLSERFDRRVVDGERRRLHFASAMTLLGHSDGAGAETGVSYLDLAEILLQFGAAPGFDLRQLWLRIIFSIAVGNTDDHLRNHGFLLTREGWRLSPAYDINPSPDEAGLSLNISETDNALSFDLAVEMAPFFRVEKKEANQLVKSVRAITGRWRTVARDLSITRSDQDAMEVAFVRFE
jgi:serine/threonine-protein kinase HipA